MKTLNSLFVSAILITSVVTAQIPTKGLVAYYPFNGNANDQSGNNVNGTVNGATLTADRFGNPNSAYQFNGTTNYIDCGTASSTINFSGGISFCAWINVAKDTNSSVVDEMTSSGNGFRTSVRAKGNGQDFWATSGSYLSGVASQSTSTFSTGNWYSIVGTWGLDDSVRIYFNGALQQQSFSTYNFSNTQDIFIGRGRLSSIYEFFNGVIDDIRIYNRAITSGEVNAIYNEAICSQNITVTDTLVINTTMTGFNPVTFANSIKIYPNPANSQITIDNGNNFSGLTGYTIKITNTLGQTEFSSLITQKQFVISLSTWTGKGVYFVNLIDGSGNTIDIRKIVLQ